jgi:hypothetical protein
MIRCGEPGNHRCAVGLHVLANSRRVGLVRNADGIREHRGETCVGVGFLDACRESAHEPRCRFAFPDASVPHTSTLMPELSAGQRQDRRELCLFEFL